MSLVCGLFQKDVARRVLTADLAFDAAEREAGRENGQKPVSMDQQRKPVRERDETQRHELFQTHGLLVIAPQIDHEPPDTGSEQRAHAEAHAHRPKQIHARPAHAQVTERVQREQAQPQHDEGKRGAVVQTGFTG
jgi:hypothetical protein